MKYYYHTKYLRCKVTYYNKFKCFRLQLQCRWFWFVWRDCWLQLDVHLNAFENDLPNPTLLMRGPFERCEAWKAHTMNIPMRVSMLFEEYDNRP